MTLTCQICAKQISCRVSSLFLFSAQRDSELTPPSTHTRAHSHTRTHTHTHAHTRTHTDPTGPPAPPAIYSTYVFCCYGRAITHISHQHISTLTVWLVNMQTKKISVYILPASTRIRFTKEAFLSDKKLSSGERNNKLPNNIIIVTKPLFTSERNDITKTNADVW